MFLPETTFDRREILHVDAHLRTQDARHRRVESYVVPGAGRDGEHDVIGLLFTPDRVDHAHSVSCRSYLTHGDAQTQTMRANRFRKFPRQLRVSTATAVDLAFRPVFFEPTTLHLRENAE